MKPPKNERKDFRIWTELSGAALSENTISGAAAVIGNVDCYGDVLFPGAFPKLVLADFLRTGFVPDSHNWGSMAQMVAMPTSIKEQGRQIFGEAEFHGTEYAQNVRQICMERMAKGLAVGLSIAFYLDYSDAEARMWFESGEQMAKYIKDTGLDQSLFDMKGIKVGAISPAARCSRSSGFANGRPCRSRPTLRLTPLRSNNLPPSSGRLLT